MATVDANGNFHGRNGRFIPKHSYDYPDEDIVIELEEKAPLVEIPPDTEHILTKEEYSAVAQHLANLKRKYGDNFPDLQEHPFVLGDSLIILNGTFEEFTVDYKGSKDQFLYYFFKEQDDYENSD